MRIVRFQDNDTISFGVLEGESTLIKISGSIFEQLSLTDERIPIASVKILPPIEPKKMIAIGLNYKKHAKEVSMPLPKEPLLFLVSPTAIVGPEEEIILFHPENKTEHEGELAIVIGKLGKNISVEETSNYVLGYTCCNDISDRHIQQKDGQFTRAKSYPTYKPLGPFISTDIDSDNVTIKVKVNDVVKQESNTSDMIFSVAEIISFVSKVMMLEPGDVIITGTPSGVSQIKDGDTVTVDIEGIGELRNKVTIKKDRKSE